MSVPSKASGVLFPILYSIVVLECIPDKWWLVCRHITDMPLLAHYLFDELVGILYMLKIFIHTMLMACVSVCQCIAMLHKKGHHARQSPYYVITTAGAHRSVIQCSGIKMGYF